MGRTFKDTKPKYQSKFNEDLEYKQKNKKDGKNAQQKKGKAKFRKGHQPIEADFEDSDTDEFTT